MILLAAVAVMLAGCHPLNGHSSSTTTAPPTTVKPHPTTVPGGGSSGERTVLSPIGINVHAQPSKAAKVLGAADQGTVLHVLGYTAAAGGWYKVRGQTVTGWVIASPSLTAPGVLSVSSTGTFGALYPTNWSTGRSGHSIVFRSPGSAVTIGVRAGTRASQFGAGHPGYGRIRSSQVVVCGVTSSLDVYSDGGTSATTTAAHAALPPYLVQVRLQVDPQHALAVDAGMANLADLNSVDNFLNSMTFPFPVCVGK